MKGRSLAGCAALCLLLSCASRTFHVNTEPITAKVYFQTFKASKFKGYSPLSFEVDKDDIGPSSKIVVETDGYKRGEVEIGGFEGTDVHLLVKLEPEAPPLPAVVSDQAADMSQVSDKKPVPNTESQTAVAPEPPAVAPQPVQPAPQAIPLPGAIETANAAEDSSDSSADLATGDVSSDQKAPEVSEDVRKLQDEIKKLQDELYQNRSVSGGIDQGAPNMSVANINKALNHVMRAQRFIQQKKLEEALIETFKALAINDKLATAYALQGSIYFLKKDFPSCLAAWQQAFVLDPANTEVYEMLKFVKAKLGQ